MSKRVVFVIAAVGCGAAGGLTVLESLNVQPDSAFSVQWTAFMIFTVVIGGLGTPDGSILGAVTFLLSRTGDGGCSPWATGSN